ncbi:hypothetical protein F5X98DRAFT_368834 [Xylaria grammica]|nr:hypothetical protein F5X98DRAFT_368834 [Xylaria grammica]
MLPFASPKFTRWYPQFAEVFEAVLEDHCTTALQEFRDGSSTSCPDHRRYGSATFLKCSIQTVLDCLLENTSESVKTATAAASVLLGFLPTILGLVGSSTAESGLIALRRPMLTTLLALGAPAMSPIRTFEYRTPTELLSSRADSIEIPRMGAVPSAAITALQYLLAAAAAVNTAHVSWQLGNQAFCSLDVDSDFFPLVWSSVSVVVFALGSISTYIRVSLVSVAPTRSRCLGGFLRSEFTLSANRGDFKLHVKQERYMFILLSWLTSVLTVLYILFGTVVLSSIQFVGAEDALRTFGRYFASAVVCRSILMFEMSGMRSRAALMPQRPSCHGARAGLEFTPERDADA